MGSFTYIAAVNYLETIGVLPYLALLSIGTRAVDDEITYYGLPIQLLFFIYIIV